MTDLHATAGGAFGTSDVIEHTAPFCTADFLSHVSTGSSERASSPPPKRVI